MTTKPKMVCTGCGSTQTIEEIRAEHPGALSCCPERKMVPACPHCGDEPVKGCGGDGWLEPLGPYRDGSYMTSRPCPNDNPLAID